LNIADLAGRPKFGELAQNLPFFAQSSAPANLVNNLHIGAKADA
jgi:hypothetical protein